MSGLDDSIFAATTTIGDITSYLDKRDLYDPITVLKDKAEEVYGKLIKLIEKSYPEFLLPGTASGIDPTTRDQLTSINDALASIDKDGTGTQRFVELKMIIQMYADLLHEIAEGTLSSSDETIQLIMGYAKGLAGLFDDMISNGINIIKNYKGYASGDYRYLKKYLFGITAATTPNDLLDLTELDDSVVPLVIFNVRNKIRDDSIFWDDGKWKPDEQRSYLLTGMKAVEFKHRIENGDVKPLQILESIVTNTSTISRISTDMTKEALKGPDGMSLIMNTEFIISKKRDELKSLDDGADDGADDGGMDVADDGDDDDYIIQAHYYKPGEFFHNILGEIFSGSVPKNLSNIADELDAKIVTSVPRADKVIPMTREVKVGHGEFASTKWIHSTHPYRGVSIQAVQARSFLEHVLKKEIIKHISLTSVIKSKSGLFTKIKDLSTKIKSDRVAITTNHDITSAQLDILIGWKRAGLIKPIKISKKFYHELDGYLKELLKSKVEESNVDPAMLNKLLIRMIIANKNIILVGATVVKTIGTIVTVLKELIDKEQVITTKALMIKILKKGREYLDTVKAKKLEESYARSGRLMNLSGRVGGGKRNTKKQKKNQKKKTMKAPHKRTIKKRKRRKNKTSKNRS